MQPSLPNTHSRSLPFVLLLSILHLPLVSAHAQGTAFNYQGQLSTPNGPANGTYELTFTLYDTSQAPGNRIAGPITNSPIAISNGLFTVTLDFGGVFDGSPRWLEIGVRTNGGGSFVTLSPRQQITPTPYALYAENATMLANGVALGSGIGNLIQPNVAINSFIGGGSNNMVFSTDALITGGNGNQIGDVAHGAVIGGGGFNFNNATYGTLGGGILNSVLGPSATVGGGSNNIANAPFATVAGGDGNRASGTESTVGGGTSNTASGLDATVGGGFESTASGSGATVAGGNCVASGNWATVGGGAGNFAGGNYATASGGLVNYATNDYSTASGGFDNNAFGVFATVPGGRFNEALGAASFAAGDGAEASTDNTFVWSDGENRPYTSDRANQFKIQAGGGVVMDVSGSSGLNPAALRVNSTSGNAVGLWIVTASSDASAVFSNAGTGDIIKGFNADFGGNPVFEVVNNGTVYSQGVALISDRTAKENFAAVSPEAILDKVLSLPISEWNYKIDPAGQKHVGPVAQDFHAAFGLNGADDKHISVVDEGGVALAAIQGLNQKVNERDAEIQSLKRQNEALEKRLGILEQALRSLADKH